MSPLNSIPSSTTSSSGTTAASQGTTGLGSPGTPANNPKPIPGTDWGYNAYQAPLFGGSNRVNASDVVQQSSRINDCYMLADLQVLANINSQFITDHVKEIPNPNDPQHPNYQVTLFKDGKPFDVVVDGKQMLSTQDSSNLASGAGNTDTGQGPSTSLWPTVYEKAYAIATGKGISDLDIDSPNKAWETLTGSAGFATLPRLAPNDFASTVQDYKKGDKGGMVISTKDNFMDIGQLDDKLNQSLGDGRYKVKADASGASVHITDTQSPNQQSWDIQLNHIMTINSVTSLDSEHPDPTTVTDPDKLLVNLSNPMGPSTSNIQNLQGIPYTVLQGISKAFVHLPAPQK